MLLERKTAGASIRLVLAMALMAGIVAAGTLMPAPAVLAASGWSLPRNLSERTGEDVYETRLAVGPDGFPHVVWREWDGADNQIYYTRKTGNGWTAPVNLSSGFGGNYEPRIAVDGSGNPHVVWYGNDVIDIVLYTTSSDGGHSWGSITCLNTVATTDNIKPDIALDRDGLPHVVWSADEAGEDYVFYTRNDGAAWTAPEKVSPGVGGAYAPVLALDDDDHPHVAWRGNDGVTTRIYYGTRGAGGWASPKNVSPGVGLTVNRFPDLALDPEGHPHVVWQSITSGNQIYYAADTGSGWSAPGAISSGFTDNWHPRLKVDGEGVLHAAWQGSDGIATQACYSVNTGGGWSAPSAISAGSTDNTDIQLALDGKGFPHAVWHGVEDSVERIFFSKNTGSGWATPISISSGVVDNHAPQIALDPEGFPHVAWYGSDSAHNQAWYANDISEQYKSYFAEGCTGAGFQEYLCLGNPAASDQSVKATFLFTDGTSLERTYSVPATSRFTVNVNAEVGEGRDVSIKCTSSAVFVAERPMYFDYTGGGGNWTGGSDVIGAPALSNQWYFAEGYTGPGFDEYVCVLNPGAETANLTFNFQTEEEGSKVPDGVYVVAAHSRATFKANDLLGGSGYQTSLELESDQPVVAERPMYFDYQGTAYWGWTGGHCVMGRTSFSGEYFFAEGTTRTGFEEWLTLQNPGSSAINVHADYQLGTGETVVDDYVVNPSSRLTVYVPDVVGGDQDVSIHLTSSSDFLAERPMYFYYSGTAGHDWTGGHCVIGATTPGRDWFFAEGYTGDGFDEWLCIQNPGAVNAEVEIYYYPESGDSIFKEYLVPAGTRFTVNVNADAGPGLSISAGVVSDQPVIVERPMYFNYGGSWTGGHDVLGLVP